MILSSYAELGDPGRWTGWCLSEAAPGLSRVMPFLLEGALQAAGVNHQTGPELDSPQRTRQFLAERARRIVRVGW